LDSKNFDLLKNYLKCKNVRITTVLSHYSTQMNNVDQFKRNLESLIKSYKRLNEMFPLENINLGGGFPEAIIMPKAQLKKIAIMIKEKLDANDISYKKIYFEPGRYFVGDAGVFLTKIVRVTDDRWIFLNIGNHICPKFARSSLRFYNASRISEAHDTKTSIAGIVPTDQDVLVKNYFFSNHIKKGDIVMIPNVGAYTLTFSNRFPYPLPNIFIIKSDEISKIFDNSINKDFSLS
jgi:diaminopimelate decarboxylase